MRHILERFGIVMFAMALAAGPAVAQTAKLDITRAEERGLTMGLNEFSGYVGVAIAGILTAYAAEWLGARVGLLIFGMAVVLLALLLTVVWVKDTLPWAKAETAAHKAAPPKSLPRYPQGVSEHPTTREVFALMSWRDPRLFAISQAGLVEKFVDALVRRYNGDGVRRIQKFEIWNEPNFQGYAYWRNSAADLAAVGRTVYQTAKAVDPGIQVLWPAFVEWYSGPSVWAGPPPSPRSSWTWRPAGRSPRCGPATARTTS